MDEHQLISLAREGHHNAFRQLYDAHKETVYRLAYRYVRSQQDAEDIMQDTFIKAFRGIQSFSRKNDAAFSSWLSRICINNALDLIRKNKRRKIDRFESLENMVTEPESTGQSPEQAAQSEQTRRLMLEAVQTLSPKQQVIFDLRYGQHRAIKEIADCMNCSESSIKTHLFRLMSKLRRQLKPILEER
jgi:RNA polymerase sigma-70 factor (ECF subfamily)